MAEQNLKNSLYRRLSSLMGCLPSKVVFHWRSSFIEGRLPLMVIFRRWSSSINGCLPSKAVFHSRLSSIKGRLPWKVIFYQRLYSIKGDKLSSGGTRCALDCFNTNGYYWNLSRSKMAGGQREKATYRGSRYRSAQKVFLNIKATGWSILTVIYSHTLKIKTITKTKLSIHSQ